MNKTIFFSLILGLSILIFVSIILKEKPVVVLPQAPKILLDPTISASSSIIVMYTATSSTILFKKNENLELPIASITKLFTAYVSSTSPLFQPLLIESSNEAAIKIANKKTLFDMNAFAFTNRLDHTHFFNPTGLDTPGPNTSSAFDLAQAIHTMYKTEHGKEIFDITKTITPKATNKSLTDPRIPFTILGGKTGETARAGQTLTLITTGPHNSILVFVVLGSKNRFEDMAILTKWAHEKTN